MDFDFSELTIDDLIANPTKYGVPSFGQFKKNRQLYMGREDESMSQVSNGSKVLGKYVKNHRYYFGVYKCHTLEEVERTALNHGIPLSDLVYVPELIPTGGQWADMKVTFMSKEEYNRRKAQS